MQQRGTRGDREEPPQEVDELARAVIQAAVEVHRNLGPGFLEAVYEDALCIELELRGLPFVRQPMFAIDYKGRPVGEGRFDLLVANRLIVELKAVSMLSDVHAAQLLSYLKAARLPLGLLINFNVAVLLRGVRRIISSQHRGALAPWRPGG